MVSRRPSHSRCSSRLPPWAMTAAMMAPADAPEMMVGSILASS
jgi:hypothetical protein